MDGRQFDALSRTLANRTSRRGAIRAGGAGAALAGLFGLSRVNARAQDDDLGGDPFEQTETGIQPDGSCHLFFEANVRVGPSSASDETARIAGLLALRIGENGGIDDSTLELEDGTIYPVIGQASGRSISLRISIGEDTLVAVGASERNVRSCAGEMGGPATGPIRGDLGDWIAYPVGGNGEEPTPEVTATSTVTAQPTPTVDCSGVFCDGAFVPHPETCDCYCPGTECGSTCCPSGFVCNDPGSGSCSCPQDSYFCGDACVTCAPGQDIDYNTCSCHEACAPGANWCPNASQCVSCSQGQSLDYSTCTCVDPPCPPGQDLCNGVCTSIVQNVNHCGACNNVCPPGMPCYVNYCACPPGQKYCSNVQQCKNNNETC